jgi:hypothetical protein
MRKSAIGNHGAAAARLSLVSFESMPWRKIAVDAGLLALFLLTSSWFVRG